MSNDPAPSSEVTRAAANPQTSLERLLELAQIPTLAPIIAANPAASPPLLHALADSPDPAVRAAIAAHPNAPLDLLLQLAGEFPAAFCANPVLPLLALEQPDLPARISPDTLRRLLRHAGVPPSILHWIAAHAAPPEAAAAQLHIGLAGKAGADWPTAMREALWHATPPSYSDLLLELLALGAVPAWLIEPLAAANDPEVRLAVARSPDTPRALLRSLRRAGASGDLRGYVPAAPNCPAELLAWLAVGGPYARRIAARHPSTPVPALARLAADPDRAVRQGVAHNPSATPALLARLAADRSADVRELVGRHSAVGAVLDRLARDSSHGVRFAVARNPATPTATLARLAADPDRAVRQGVARNSSTTPELLERLLADPHPRVRAAAQRAGTWPVAERTPINAAPAPHPPLPATDPNTPIEQLRELAEHHDARVRAAVARNPATPPDLLAWLADDESPIVHRAVAEHPNVPSELLDRFAADPTWVNYKVRLAVAHHPRVSASALERMAGDLAVAVRRLVLAHPLTPPAARAQILARSLEMCLMSREPFYHAIVLAHPQAPAAAFQQAADSPEWLVRLAATQNPHVPRPLLMALAEDGNRLVRAAARAALLDHA